MKKIPTLFKKTFVNGEYIGVSNIFNDEIDGLDDCIANNWDNVIATIKYDGTACYIHNDWIYRRYNNKTRYDKNGNPKSKKKLPSGAILCDDSVPPHEIYWVPCDKNNPQDKYHFEAFEWEKKWRDMHETNLMLEGQDVEHHDLNEWTYELCGPKFQSNPYRLDHHILIDHGCMAVNVPVSFNEVVDWLRHNKHEGLVFWEVDSKKDLVRPIAKIRRKDFGMEWPIKEDNNEV